MPATDISKLIVTLSMAFLLASLYHNVEIEAYVSKPKIFYDLAMNATFPDTVLNTYYYH